MNWIGQRYHFVGVGGCGMSGLALALHELGAVVSGSDAKDSAFLRSLRERGLDVRVGHDASAVPPNGTLVYSSAVGTDNPEREAARASGLREMHRSALLASLTRTRRTLAVCGAHGKTTTAALLAHVLRECGIDPSYIVGGMPHAPMPHSRMGTSEYMIIEADESDRSLLRYSVDTLIVTNIDLDHIRDGGYKSKADVGAVIAELGRVARQVLAFEHSAEHLAGCNLRTLCVDVSAAEGTFEFNGDCFRAHLPGAHQAENAALAIAAAIELGCPVGRVRDALVSFPGVARRFEVLGVTASGALVVEDYAHHPAEIAAVLHTARHTVSGRVVVVFQPHLFSRTAHFAAEFARALAGADAAYIEEIYPSREQIAEWPQVSRELILRAADAEGVSTLCAAPSRRELVATVTEQALKGDVILLVGAGDVGSLGPALVGGESRPIDCI